MAVFPTNIICSSGKFLNEAASLYPFEMNCVARAPAGRCKRVHLHPSKFFTTQYHYKRMLCNRDLLYKHDENQWGYFP